MLAILLLGQSLRAGADVLCCQSTDTESAASSCHSTESTLDLSNADLPVEEESNCSECHCPGCFVGMTTLIEPIEWIDYTLPNFSNPVLYQRQIHSSDYAFSPWQPPQLF
ncbi:MAG: hypothetical protein AB8G22_14715 [Saprospiraceae bacterium]